MSLAMEDGYGALVFDYRATSGHAGASVTNARLQVLSATSGAVLLTQSLASGGTKDMGWRHHEASLAASSLASATQLRVVLSLTDSWSANWSQTVAIDNVRVAQ